MSKTAIQKTLNDLGLTITSEFVPFSQSRNRAEKHPSLNWKVTLHKGDRAILTTDYMAGCGHCPAYKAKDLGMPNSLMRDKAIRFECERGFGATTGHIGPLSSGKPLQPDTLDVIHSLVMDADVLDHGSFEDWASSLGYDSDSRKAEGVYRACLSIALQLRNALGDDGLRALQSAFQEY